MADSPFYVWRRSDGYVGTTRGIRPPRNGKDTFEVLLITHEWSEAHDLLVEERKDQRHLNIIASWGWDG